MVEIFLLFHRSLSFDVTFKKLFPFENFPRVKMCVCENKKKKKYHERFISTACFSKRTHFVVLQTKRKKNCFFFPRVFGKGTLQFSLVRFPIFKWKNSLWENETFFVKGKVDGTRKVHVIHFGKMTDSKWKTFESENEKTKYI